MGVEELDWMLYCYLMERVIRGTLQVIVMNVKEQDTKVYHQGCKLMIHTTSVIHATELVVKNVMGVVSLIGYHM